MVQLSSECVNDYLDNFIGDCFSVVCRGFKYLWFGLLTGVFEYAIRGAIGNHAFGAVDDPANRVVD